MDTLKLGQEGGDGDEKHDIIHLIVSQVFVADVPYPQGNAYDPQLWIVIKQWCRIRRG